MGLQLRLYLLLGLMLGILYLVILIIGGAIDKGGVVFYASLAVGLVFFQYLIGPSLVRLMMKVKWVSEDEEPELHRMVAELAERAGIPKPKVGISHLGIPNAFAFGRSRRDGRVCITEGIRRLLSRDELKAVIGHEIAHIKNRDMLIITLLSAIPLILYWIAWRMMWGGMLG